MAPFEHPVWHPYAQHGLVKDFPLVERAQGAWLYTRDGRAILDAVSSWWVTLHGHGQPHIAQAVARQAAQLDQVIFASFTHPPAQALAQKLLALAPAGLETVFYSDNGSTAVEVALKMAMGHWAAQGRPKRLFAALEHAYHGDTFGAMAVGARGPFSGPYEANLFEVARLPFPAPGQEEETLAALARLIDQRGDELAGLIVEPLVLGAGGMLTYPAWVLKKLEGLCRQAGVLLLVDEVMTGFGRTGTLFAVEQAQVAPDLMCLSKGITGGFLPLGATLATRAVFESFYGQDRAKTFFHGHSYTANPLACAAAVASLELFEREPVMERVAAIAAHHTRALARLKDHPRVAAVRQAGTIAAVEFSAGDGGYLNNLAPRLAEFYLSRNVLLRPLGPVVYLLPPYCFGRPELEQAWGAVEASLEWLG